MDTQWFHNAVTLSHLYYPKFVSSVLGEARIENSFNQLTTENKTIFNQKATEKNKATKIAEQLAKEDAQTNLDQQKTLGIRYEDPNSLLGFGGVKNNLNYLAAVVPKQLNLSLKVFLGLVVVLLIAWIIFKSVAVHQRNIFLKDR